MELSDIFRHEDRRLYPEVANLQARYDRLRGRFEQFVRCFPPERGKFPEGGEFLPDTDLPLLTVRFCGKEFRFCFDMVKEQGQVRCLISSPNEEEEAEELSRFTFNREGITNIIPSGSRDADPLVIHEAPCAYGIVASFLVAPF